jgi:hypothetical protein
MDLETTDLTDPALLIEREWGDAINQWFERRPERLAELLRNADGPIPEGAREFLADLVAGKVSRGKGGRPPERDGWVERSILAEVFREWEKAEGIPRPTRAEAPKDVAYRLVAERRGETVKAIMGIVERHAKLGLTQDRWESWGRPDWSRKITTEPT